MVREGPGGHSRGPGGILSPSRRLGQGLETLLEVREGLERPGGSEAVETSFQRSGRGQYILPEVWKGSGGPPGCPGDVGRASWRSERVRETLL